MPIVQFSQPNDIVLVATIDRQFNLASSMIHPQQRIAILQFEHDKVLRITFCKIHHWTLVEDESIFMNSHQLEARVSVLALS